MKEYAIYQTKATGGLDDRPSGRLWIEGKHFEFVVGDIALHERLAEEFKDKVTSSGLTKRRS